MFVTSSLTKETLVSGVCENPIIEIPRPNKSDVNLVVIKCAFNNLIFPVNRFLKIKYYLSNQSRIKKWLT